MSIVNRLLHYTAETYYHDEDKLTKLKHDFVCGIYDAVKPYQQDAQNWHTLCLKLTEEYVGSDNPDIQRIMKWVEDQRKGINIKYQHGYRG